jgi:predicted nucleotidyltransferase
MAQQRTMQQLVDAFLADLDAAIGATYAAVLFGSAARGDYVEGVSDVNVLLVLDEASPATLARLERPLAAWYEAGQVAPLLITRAEWARAQDVFPIEVVDLQEAHRVLRGRDPVGDLTVNRAHLRLALEADLRGKLLRLRRGYVALHRDPVAMSRLLLQSVPQLLLLLRAVIRLTAAEAPREHEALARAAAGLIGFDAEAVLRVDRQRREDTPWRASGAEYEAYMAAVERTVAFVDSLTEGAKA